MFELLFNFLGLIIILLGVLLLIGFMLLARSGFKPALRPLRGYDSLQEQVGQAVESGGRVHVSLGPNSIIGEETATTLAGLAMLDITTERSAISDRPPIGTTADATTLPVLSDTMRRAYQRQGSPENFTPVSARLVALDALTLAAGATGIIADDDVRANVLIGSFGSEVALMAEAGARQHVTQTIGSDRLEGQAVSYVMADSPLIGEELYAARAYLTGEPSATAGLAVQDVLRWVIIGFILFGAVLQTLGLLQ